jgi:hypothetical protein
MGLGGLRSNRITTPLLSRGLRPVRGTGTAGNPAGPDVTGLDREFKHCGMTLQFPQGLSLAALAHN